MAGQPPMNMRNPPAGMSPPGMTQSGPNPTVHGMPPKPVMPTNQGMPPNQNMGNRPPGSNMPPGSRPPPNLPPPNGSKGGPKVVDAPEDEPPKGKFRDCCKKVLKFAFSHIGLCGMVIAYSVAGGFIFQHLEKTNEKQECVKAKERYDPLQNNTMHRLWEIASTFRTDDDQDYALLEFEKQLKKFRDDVIALGYDGTNCTAMDDPDGPGYKWSFPGALLFSVTVITTIGYGNIAPKTFWGRLVCMAYALLGIPLMLLCLANIGDVMADIFRFVYTRVCCCGCCRRKNKREGAKTANNTTPEAWKNEYSANRQDRNGPVVIDDDDDDDDDEDDDEDDKISVPLTITMIVIGGYIGMGALLFGVWEGWDPLKASYYCFVTISTIGFGDIVPGSATLNTPSERGKMIGAAIYLLFGMAILSMCFSLIQEEIVSKFRWIGEKLGIVEKNKDKDDDVDDEDNDDDDKKRDQQKNNSKLPQQASATGQHGIPPPKYPPPSAWKGKQPPASDDLGDGPKRPASTLDQKQHPTSVNPSRRRPVSGREKTPTPTAAPEADKKTTSIPEEADIPELGKEEI